MAVSGAPVVLALLVVAGGGCTSSKSVTRELPILGSIGSYLDGCAPEPGEGGIARMRCPDGIMVATRSRTAGVGEPAYREEAFGMAQVAGGRLVWDQIVVPTEGPSGLVDRARALAPGSETASAELIGVTRSIGRSQVEEVWCTSSDEAGAVRCRDLLGVVLGGPAEVRADATAASPGGTATSTSGSGANGNGAPLSPPALGSITFYGRALSLPTACRAQTTPDGGEAQCSDGASLTWARFDEMEEATNVVHATLEALGDHGEGASYACHIGGEAAQCEARPKAAAGIAYVDGRPTAVLCLGVDEAKDHSLCRAVLVPR